MSSSFKDLFSGHSSDYARFRPTYPPALFEFLARVAPSRQLAWDCGTGNGQAALELAEHFGKVIATDPSEKQIASAASHPRIEYRVGAAESSNLPDASADLITVAQAFHWFKHEAFFGEARRVLKPRGVLAVWCYSLASITPEIDAVVQRLYSGILETFWEKERKLVDSGYAEIQFPGEKLSHPDFEMKADWSLEQWRGYLGTWSAVKTYIQRQGTDPLRVVEAELRSTWGETKTRTVRWPLTLHLSRLA